MNAREKSPSARRVVVTVGALLALASAVTPASATPRARETLKKHSSSTQQPRHGTANRGGGGGLLSIEWTVSSTVRP